MAQEYLNLNTMKVKILEKFYVPSIPEFYKDEVREVDEDLGELIISRGLGVEVKEKKEVKKEKKDKNN